MEQDPIYRDQNGNTVRLGVRFAKVLDEMEGMQPVICAALVLAADEKRAKDLVERIVAEGAPVRDLYTHTTGAIEKGWPYHYRAITFLTGKDPAEFIYRAVQEGTVVEDKTMLDGGKLPKGEWGMRIGRYIGALERIA